MQLVNGEWVWIAESDDWCETNLLETLVQGVDDSVGLAIAQSVVVKETGEILWKSQAAFFAKIYSGKDFVTERMLLDNFGLPNASMCIFKKELYYQIDKQFTSYKFCGDWLFWIMEWYTYKVNLEKLRWRIFRSILRKKRKLKIMKNITKLIFQIKQLL